MRTADSDPNLDANLETALPQLPVGRATAIFCLGTCFHRHRPIQRLEISIDGARHRPAASRMPRPDLFRALHPALPPAQPSARRDPHSTHDPELRCYRSGFWATIPIEPRDRPGQLELRVEARLSNGHSASASLGSIEVIEPEEPPSYDGLPDRPDGPLIAICMATFDPDIELFRTQIESLRAQTDTNWICLISDDCSQPERFEEIEKTVAHDSRFVVSRSDTRLGFYRNFERALEMVPVQASLVGLCDQDDRWYPDKLETLRNALGEAQLAYSDQRLVDRSGRVLAETLWEGRRNNYTNFASLVIANSIPGAASLFRREVIDFALPFPDAPATQYHDHWLGLVAMATGELAYVDRPLYDYVQHPRAVQGWIAVDRDTSTGPVRGARRRPSLRSLRGLFRGSRAAYFCGYIPLEVQARTLLARCSSRLTARKRRTLTRFVASARSPLGLAWLAARPVRELFGHNETLGAEGLLAKGILWRHVVAALARAREKPNGLHDDASLPAPESFEQKRLRRWRAGR